MLQQKDLPHWKVKKGYKRPGVPVAFLRQRVAPEIGWRVRQLLLACTKTEAITRVVKNVMTHYRIECRLDISDGIYIFSDSIELYPITKTEIDGVWQPTHEEKYRLFYKLETREAAEHLCELLTKIR